VADGCAGRFSTRGRAAHSDDILGALVVTVAIIAVAEVTCAARFINIALALGIIVLLWLFGGATLPSGINDLIIGVLIIALRARRRTACSGAGCPFPVVAHVGRLCPGSSHCSAIRAPNRGRVQDVFDLVRIACFRLHDDAESPQFKWGRASAGRASHGQVNRGQRRMCRHYSISSHSF